MNLRKCHFHWNDAENLIPVFHKKVHCQPKNERMFCCLFFLLLVLFIYYKIGGGGGINSQRLQAGFEVEKRTP